MVGENGGEQPDNGTDPLLDLQGPRTTGGLIVVFKDDTEAAQRTTALERHVGRSRELHDAEEFAAFSAAPEAEEITSLLADTGIAFVPPKVAAESAGLAATFETDDTVAEARPEFYLYSLQPPPFSDTPERTWGVAAVGAETNPFRGEGIRLAVLDTGLDLQHPDYAGRSIVTRSFVAGESVDDLQGHGTHCAGTAAGGPSRQTGLRYGVAPDAELVIGKVLNNRGSGRERDILDGMLWAIQQGCEVISMSLGRRVQVGEPPSLSYERMGQIAFRNGSLIVAAAGNDSDRRFGYVAPVGAPANSPSIMAVAAVDRDLSVANFSNGGINADGGAIDLAAPGVGVASSVPMPAGYARLQGTSMACPHVAGAAALWAQSDPSLRGQALWSRLVSEAQSISAPARDAGAGLVQAPQPVA